MLTSVFVDIEILELEVPFENPSSSFVYLLDSKILVDAGFCSADNAEKIRDLDPEIAIITHHHIDHVGYVFFANLQFYMHPLEIGLMKLYETPEAFIKWQADICNRYGIDLEYIKPLKVLSKLALRIRGSLRSFEELNLEVLTIPGHSPGHLCVLADNALFSGDAILSDTTPNLSFYPHLEVGLEEYLKALENLKRGEIEVIYPAHEKRINNPTERIEVSLNTTRKDFRRF